jgi:hypothetical protein
VQKLPLRSSTLVCVLALLLVASAPALGGRVPGQVLARAVREGRVPVLVHLSVPFEAEGWLSASGRSQQRQEIAAAQAALLSALGTSPRVRHRYRTVPVIAMQVGPGALAALESSPWVHSVTEDGLGAFVLDSTVPLVQADQTTALGLDGTDQIVVVIDTGIDGSHPNLAGKIVDEACFSGDQDSGDSGDCPNGQKTQLGSGAGAYCAFHADCFHGSHVAGIASAASTPNWPGVAPAAKLISIRVASLIQSAAQCGGETPPCLRVYDSDELAAVEHVYDQFHLEDDYPIASVNISIGGATYSSQSSCDSAYSAMKAAIDNLRSVGIPTVVASGNNGSSSSISQPACISSAVSVGSTRDNDLISSYSNHASFLSLWAPGQSVRAPRYQTNNYLTASGTSMAAPHVAGAWAALREAFPNATVDDILTALQDTGEEITAATPDATRMRLLDAYDALGTDCDDGLDNDGDGLVDDADPGCDDVEDDSERGSGVCDNGLNDDDDDLLIDYPDDPGCRNAYWQFEDPKCQDGEDNDGDGGFDFDGGASANGGSPLGPADAACVESWKNREISSPACGFGFEVALLLLPVWWLRKRSHPIH